jgi:hypothetical protein
MTEAIVTTLICSICGDQRTETSGTWGAGGYRRQHEICKTCLVKGCDSGKLLGKQRAPDFSEPGPDRNQRIAELQRLDRLTPGELAELEVLLRRKWSGVP